VRSIEGASSGDRFVRHQPRTCLTLPAGRSPSRSEASRSARQRRTPPAGPAARSPRPQPSRCFPDMATTPPSPATPTSYRPAPMLASSAYPLEAGSDVSTT